MFWNEMKWNEMTDNVFSTLTLPLSSNERPTKHIHAKSKYVIHHFISMLCWTDLPPSLCPAPLLSFSTRSILLALLFATCVCAKIARKTPPSMTGIHCLSLWCVVDRAILLTTTILYIITKKSLRHGYLMMVSPNINGLSYMARQTLCGSIYLN